MQEGMVSFVLVCNGLIFLLNCYLFWQVLKIRKALTQLANRLDRLEKKIPHHLKLTTLLLLQREYQALTFRQQYGLLQQKREKLLALVQILRWLYRRYGT